MHKEFVQKIEELNDNFNYSIDLIRRTIRKYAHRNPELMQLLDTLGDVTGLGHQKR